MRPAFRVRRTVLALGLSATTLAGLLGCGDDDDVTSPFGTSIGVSLGSAAVSVQQGESGTVSVSLTRRGGFTGPITLAVTGAPAGVAASFDPLPAAGTSSTLTLDAAATAAPGTYSLTITASGPGVASRTATLSLTITTPASTPSIDVVLGSGTVSLVQGQSATVSVNIARSGGYAGDVALALSGAPSGVTGMFSPATVTGASSTLALAAAGNAAPGTYTLTITGSGTGVADASATLTLTVSSAPPAGFISVDVNAANRVLSVRRGASTNWEVIVTRGGGFTGAVDLSVEGLPPNVSAALAPATLPSGVAGSLLTLSAQSSAGLGTTSVTIRARGAGVADATVVVQVSVLATTP